ncbi:MAG: aminotransferase class I/II-fold pyridoxal phosphate-dependent enzyme [Pseudomonadota bacterium]
MPTQTTENCCTCGPGKLIIANSNCGSECLGSFIPVHELLSTAERDVFGYPRPGPELIKEIQEFTGVADQDAVFPTTSALRAAGTLINLLKPDAVVVAETDFVGFTIAANVSGAPLVRVPANLRGTNIGIEERIAATASEYVQPVIFVTVPITNPGQVRINPRVLVAAVKRRCPWAVVVLDDAYADYSTFSHKEIANLAVTNPRTVSLSPVSKLLYLPAVTTSWIITGDPAIKQALQRVKLPYEPSGMGNSIVPKALANQEWFEAAREDVKQARNVLGSGLRKVLGAPQVISGPGPWVLIDAGQQADALVTWLGGKGILVQQQSGLDPSLPSHLVRVSATASCEASRIVEKIKAYFDDPPPAFQI